jgi:hypothetical protein
VKEQTTKIEIFRSHLLDRIKESKVGTINYNSEGNPTFEVMPELSNYTWVFDLADREGVIAESAGIATKITITEEKTNE